MVTVKVAIELVMLPIEFVMTTEYVPEFVIWALRTVKVFAFAPAMGVFVLKYH